LADAFGALLCPNWRFVVSELGGFRLDLYTKALIEQMAKIPEQHVAKLVEFFRATYVLPSA